MRSLLDSSTRRKLEILEQLSERADWISSSELAENNNASLRTITTDIHYLKEQWSPFLIIETSKKNGIRLITPPSSHLHDVYVAVFKNSEALQFLEKIFFNPTHSLEEWGEKLFISDSSLYRVTNQLGHALKNYGIALGKRPCQIVSTNERFVRYFYTTYFKETYTTFEWPFSIDRTATIEFSSHLFREKNWPQDDVQLIYLSYYLAVSITRFYQGKKVSTQECEENLHSYLSFKEILAPYLKRMVNDDHLEVGEELIQDIFSSLVVFEVSKPNEESLLKEISAHLLKLQASLHLELSETQLNMLAQGYFQMYNHYLVYPFDHYILFNSSKYNGQAAYHEYPIFSKNVFVELTELEKVTNFPWYTNYRYEILFYLMTKWPTLPKQLEKKKHKVSLLVLTDLGKSQTFMLAQAIERNFSHKAVVTSFEKSILFLSEEAFFGPDDYDLFVSTIHLPNINEEKLIIVDPLPSNMDWENLRKSINNIHKMHKLNNDS